MVLHPLLDVGADAGVGTADDWSGGGPDDGRRSRLKDRARSRSNGRGRLVSLDLPIWFGLLNLLSTKGQRRRNGEQREKCRAKGEPGWTMQIHNEAVLTTTATAGVKVED
jgi:hypothetical protein